MKFRRKLYNSIQLSSQKIKTPKRNGEIFAQGQRFDFGLLYTQDYHHNRMYEQLPQQNEKKQEHNQQLYDIISRMPETPALPSAKKRW